MQNALFSANLSPPPTAQSPFDSDIEKILSLIGDGVVSIDKDGRIILFNRAAELLFGYVSAELIGCLIEVLIPLRFHVRHKMDVEGFATDAVMTRRTMGIGREVLGRHKSGREFPIEATLSQQMFAGQQVLMAVVRDVTEQKSAEHQRQMIAGEVAHRLHNTMAVVSSIVSLTSRRATSVPEFITGLLGRLAAFSRTNDILIGEACSNPDLRSLLQAELATFQHENMGFTLTGPDAPIAGKLALNLALVFHELATNAAKYGAFSTAGGQINVDWHVDAGPQPSLEIKWQETGGPEVKVPTRTGFGTQLIAQTLAAHDGQSEIIYDKDGVSCVISIPL